MPATATRSAGRDAVLEGAVDLAREHAESIATRPSDVGEHLGTVTEGERLVSHRFACTMPGYRGWAWTVTVARVPRGRTATVCEVELLPDAEAILAQPWVPWEERLQPGDLGPSDVLPFKADDPRLVPGFEPTGDEEIDSVAIGELALARARVLSEDGKREAAARWVKKARERRAARGLPGTCSSCGFMVTLQGSLGQVFAVCANEWSPDDGHVVPLGHTCGGHSETDVEVQPTNWPDTPEELTDIIIEDAGDQ